MKDEKCAEVIEKLLTQRADINAKDPRQGRTPLHAATYRGRHKSAEILIAAGADLNVKDNEGRTPLDIAERRGHTEIVELLREHGAEE